IFHPMDKHLNINAPERSIGRKLSRRLDWYSKGKLSQEPIPHRRKGMGFGRHGMKLVIKQWSIKRINFSKRLIPVNRILVFSSWKKVRRSRTCPAMISPLLSAELKMNNPTQNLN